MNADELLSMKQTAEALEVSMPTFYEMMKRGDIAPAQIRQMGQQQRRFFRRSDVEQLRQRRSGGEAQA